MTRIAPGNVPEYLSPAALSKYGDDISKNPVGTGPYLFAEWVADTVKIKKNPDYWRGPVKVDSITFRPVENGSRLAMLRACQAQYIYPMPAELLNLAQSDAKVEIIGRPSIEERWRAADTQLKCHVFGNFDLHCVHLFLPSDIDGVPIFPSIVKLCTQGSCRIAGKLKTGQIWPVSLLAPQRSFLLRVEEKRPT